MAGCSCRGSPRSYMSRRSCRSAFRSIREHHGFPAVQDDAILEVVAQRARQHAPLDVAALADQIGRRIAMADPLNVLLDDRPLVEVTGHIMRGGADHLDTALVRLVIGPRALEARQER